MERDWSKYSILIVDDDFTSIILFEEFLSPTKALIFTATNSKDALGIVNNHPLDIILMDLQLEDISGFILLSKIREINPNIPVIAETAFATSDDKRKCITAGFNGFLPKPISFNNLFLELDKYLENSTDS